MKLFTLFFIVSFFQLTANGYSQNSVIKVYDNLQNFGEVISAIEEQSEYKVFYKNEQIDLNRKVKVSEKSLKVSDLLSTSLLGTNIKFTLIDKVIVLSPKEEKELQPENVVSGKISDQEGNPIPGVTVMEKGTTNGTISDENGTYQIQLRNENSILTFSFIGYVSQEIPVNNMSELTITLLEDFMNMEEVVVVGYGQVKKSDITGSVSSVGTKEIEQGNSNDALEAIQGRASGVDITSTSRPGEVGSIRIRGERSITEAGIPSSANEPLYVVDGVPLAVTTRRLNTEPTIAGGFTTYEYLSHNPISDLNPNDIESIEILKDASATAIYGSRAANGVVLITTKRGKQGKSRITYDGSYTIENLDDRIKMFNAAEQFEQMREVGRKSRSYSVPYADPEMDYRIIGNKDYESWQSIAQGYEWEDEANRIPVMRPTTAEEKELWGVDEVPVFNPENVRETDWLKYAHQQGMAQNHQFGASVGTDKLQAYCSFGYLDQTGVEKSQEYTRYNSLISIDLALNNFIKIGGSLNGMYSDQEYGINAVDAARGMLPFAVPYDTDGNYEWLPGGESTINNFLYDIDNSIDNRKNYHFRGSFYGEIKILEGLKYRINFGPDFREFRKGVFQSAETAARWGSSSYALYFQDQSFNWTLDNLIYYDKQLGNHSIGLTLLQSSESYKYEYSHISAQDLTYDEQLWYDLGSSREGTVLDFGSNYEAQTRESYMIRMNYGLLNKYLLTLSGRWDGSSVLAEGNKWQLFPSAAFAWKLHEEAFLKNITAISMSKIRLSYGITGNSAIPPYQSGGSLQNLNYTFGGIPATGYRISTPPNADLNWEGTAQFNTGIDFGLMGNRISGSFDFYIANTNDLLMQRTIPVVNGSDNVYFNIGQTRNSGIELMISTVNVSTSDLTWRTDLTFSKNKNEIIKLYNGTNDDVANRWFIGEPINVNYGYEYDGIWQNTPEDSALFLSYNLSGSYPSGTIRIKDLNNDTTTDESDRTIRGTAYPDFIAGLTNYITYKGFELSFFIYARIGQTIGNATPSLYGRYHDIYVDYWTPDNTGGKYPRPQSGFSDGYMSSLNYQKGSFVKVRNISLKYNLPKSLINKIQVSNMSLRFQLINPFLFTKAVNTDPDMGNNPTKSYLFGINVGF